MILRVLELTWQRQDTIFTFYPFRASRKVSDEEFFGSAMSTITQL
jgi:hypothetical protein